MSKPSIISHHLAKVITDAAGITTQLRCRGSARDRRRNKRSASGCRSDFLARHFIKAHMRKREDDVFISAFSWCVSEEASHE
jgi:hypothetical protein